MEKYIFWLVIIFGVLIVLSNSGQNLQLGIISDQLNSISTSLIGFDLRFTTIIDKLDLIIKKLDDKPTIQNNNYNGVQPTPPQPVVVPNQFEASSPQFNQFNLQKDGILGLKPIGGKLATPVQ
ncbi:TPA: hypothetical protein ENS27_16290 [bacterium]|nr:hypothetical protein [bacterium]